MLYDCSNCSDCLLPWDQVRNDLDSDGLLCVDCSDKQKLRHMHALWDQGQELRLCIDGKFRFFREGY